MYKIDNATANAALPVPSAPGPNPDSFWSDGNPGGGVPATVVEAEWLNMVQEEIAAVILGAGLTLDKADRAQLLAGVQGLVAASAPGAIDGFRPVNNAVDAVNDIDFTAGVAAAENAAALLSLTATLTKQLDAAWAEGVDAGGLFSGAKAAGIWYHAFAIRKDADGTIDAGFDTSLIAANRPAGWTAYRNIGSVLTDGALAIRPFVQRGDRVLWKSPILDVTAGITPGVVNTYTISTPLGLEVPALLNVGIQSTVNNDLATYVASPLVDSELATLLAARNTFGIFVGDTVPAWDHDFSTTLTNTSSQIRISTTAPAGANVSVGTVGFIHPRGRRL